jgi:7-cyano-7-deazaguanine synthase
MIRGRDSWGYATNVDGVHRFLGEVTLEPLLEGGWAQWAVANCRAEPTTEWVQNKTAEDTHPFVSGETTVVHNGTIANDKELAATYGVETGRIDSQVLPAILDRWSVRWDRARIEEFLRNEVVGSFALAVVQNDMVLLATNFKPLYVRRDPMSDTWWWTSTPPTREDPRSFLDDVEDPWTPLPPYSTLWLTEDGAVTGSLRTPRTGPTRSLVVCSGGVDSVTTAALCVDRGDDVTLLHFTYGCRAEAREVEAVRLVAQRLGVAFLVMDMTQVFAQIGGSPLTNTADGIAGGEAGAEFAHEWVPARNLILMACATGLAESHGFNNLVLGNNLEEAGAYPDNEQEFMHLLGTLTPYAVAADVDLTIEEPVGGLVKHEIVDLAYRLGAPLDVAWSCYEGGDVHCGDCGPCFMRRMGHRMSGHPETVTYAT